MATTKKEVSLEYILIIFVTVLTIWVVIILLIMGVAYFADNIKTQFKLREN